MSRITRRRPCRIAAAVAIGWVALVVLSVCGDSPTLPPINPGEGGGEVDRDVSELVVRVLDVGAGDATVITNSRSTVIIDGGGSAARFGALLDSLQVRHTTIDLVVVSHGHSDHASGLRALFDTDRALTVKNFVETLDPLVSTGHAEVRDSVRARAGRSETTYRNADDPCGNGAWVCTFRLAGGARVHVMRPDPDGDGPDNRSVPVKLVGPDSASFTMWLAGDARHDASDWFVQFARYDWLPGMKVHVLKGQEHGNCRSTQPRYLDVLRPELVAFSLAEENGKGLVHTQTLSLLADRGIPWVRTDTNGSITIRSPGTPGSGYTVEIEHGSHSAIRPSDEHSASRHCQW